jgi:TonB family protein
LGPQSQSRGTGGISPILPVGLHAGMLASMFIDGGIGRATAGDMTAHGGLALLLIVACRPATPIEPVELDALVDENGAPIHAVRAHAIHDPDPNVAQLAQTDAAQWMERIHATIYFCVDTTGYVVDHRVLDSSGDPEVDDICFAAVDGWRFHPFLVDGELTKVCTTVTFDIGFI